MAPPFSDIVEEFVNAMQLCIQSVIRKGKGPVEGVIWNELEESIEICFDSLAKDDQNLKKIKKLVPLEKEYALGFKIKSDFFKSGEAKKLTTFLLLTRLENRNVRKMAEMDSRYASYLAKLGLEKNLDENIKNSQEAAALIFKAVENKKLTLRELSQQTGLTQATLSNFKSGKSDIRLSSLLRIASALGLKLKIQ